jgi:hypothetical protein
LELMVRKMQPTGDGRGRFCGNPLRNELTKLIDKTRFFAALSMTFSKNSRF